MINVNDKRMIGGIGINNLSPMKYPWGKQYWELGMSTHWGLEKLNMSKDYNDFRNLSPSEQHIFINVLAYLTTSDILAQRNVINVVHGHITAPEITLYLARQGFDETVHSMTYQHLIESMGLEEHDLYGRYLTVPAINDKIQYANKIMDQGTAVNPLDDRESLLTFIKSYLFFAMIFEGIWFYHGFTPILALTRKGILPGSTSAFEYIIRDECVSEDTEVLTPKGWRPVSSITLNTEIAQWSPTGVIEFVHPVHLSKSLHKEHYRFYNHEGHIDQAVTPKHRVPYFTKHGNLKVTTAEDATLHPYSHMICAGNAIGKGVHYLSPHERFLIALQADGSMPSDRYTGELCGTRPVTFGISKERKHQRLTSILKDLGYAYTQTHVAGHGNVKPKITYRVSVPIHHPLHKCLSEWVDLSDKSAMWCEAFIQEVAEWDGHRPNGDDGRVLYTNTNRASIDVVQMVATLCNRRTNITEVQDNRSPTFSPVWRLHISNRTYVQGGSISKSYRVSEEPEMYYGVQVPSSFIVIRRNNAVSITGNSNHSAFGMRVVKTIMDENNVKLADIQDDVHQMLYDAHEHEANYINFILPDGGVPGYTVKDHLTHFKYMANRRCYEFGLASLFDECIANPLPWLDQAVALKKEKNFFETSVTEYDNSGLNWD